MNQRINGEQDWGRNAPDIAPQGGGVAYGTSPSLDAKQPVGNGVKGVQYHNGVSPIVTTMTADMTNSDTNLNISASEENRSAKFKYPNNHQDTGMMYSDQK